MVSTAYSVRPQILSRFPTHASARLTGYRQRGSRRCPSRLLGTAVLALLVYGAGCSSEGTGPEVQEQYKGVMAGGDPNESTSFDVTVSGTSVAGSFKPLGEVPINVTGTYVPSSRAMTVSGAGFTVTGTIDTGGQLLGTYAHALNRGYIAGFRHTATNPVTVFCGSYSGHAEGVWNLARRSSSLVGAYVNIDGSDGNMSGTITGNDINITDIQDSPGFAFIGTLSGSTITGTWSGGGLTGTWTASTAC